VGDILGDKAGDTAVSMLGDKAEDKVGGDKVAGTMPNSENQAGRQAGDKAEDTVRDKVEARRKTK
jgi:hypothetical protein